MVVRHARLCIVADKTLGKEGLNASSKMGEREAQEKPAARTEAKRPSPMSFSRPGFATPPQLKRSSAMTFLRACMAEGGQGLARAWGRSSDRVLATPSHVLRAVRQVDKWERTLE